MEKYVPPQNNNSDFKFPASHLPLQQLGQVSILNVSAGRRGRSQRFCRFRSTRAVSPNGSWRGVTFFAGRAGYREERSLLS